MLGTGLWLLLSLGGCKGGSGGTAPAGAQDSGVVLLSLNDLSILLPLSKKADANQIHTNDLPDPATHAPELPALALDNQPFVPQSYLAQLDLELGKDEALRQQENLKTWQDLASAGINEAALFKDAVLPLVSLRLDPCANAQDIKGDVTQCAAQLRLMFQNGAADLNVRAAYHLQPAELRACAETLQNLVAAANLDYRSQPLGIQPAIAQQGLAGSYYLGVVGLVHRYARASRLVALSGLANSAAADPNALFSWSMLELGFSGGAPSGTPLAAVTYGSGEQPKVVQRQGGRAVPEQHDSSGAQVNSLGLPTPNGATADTLFPGGELATPSGATVSAHLAHIESPSLYGLSSLDCATCHRALSIRRQLKIDADPTQAFKAARWNLQNTTDLGQLPYTALQMFSYRGDQLLGSAPYLPVISQRVINETAFATDFVNDRILSVPQSPASPSP